MNDRWLPVTSGRVTRQEAVTTEYRALVSATCSAISPRTRPARPAGPDGLARRLHLLHDGMAATTWLDHNPAAVAGTATAAAP